MQTSSISTFITLLLLVISLSTKAQGNDYIITNKGDTLKGQLTGKRFKAKGWQKTKRIDLDSIKETYVADDDILKRAVYRHIDTQRVFMTVLENGRISLYQYYETEPSVGATFMMSLKTLTPSVGVVNTPYWYVAKESDTVQKIADLNIIQIKSKKRMDILAQLLIDNKVVYDKFIADDKVSLRQIRNIIHLYNTGKPFEAKPPQKEKIDTSNDFNPGQD